MNAHAADTNALLRNTHTILVIDWPSRDVPETLARAGFHVIVRGGPGPEDYASFTVQSGTVVRSPCPEPKTVDLVYAHRPVAELPDLIATATALQAGALWTQSGLIGESARDPGGCWLPAEQREAVESLASRAGLAYRSEPYIVDAVRQFTRDRGRD